MRRDRPAALFSIPLLALILSLLFAVTVRAADGDPDTSFSGDGVQIIGWSAGLASSSAKAVVGLVDGSLIVGGDVKDSGSDYDFGLVKLTRAGAVDTSWGFLGRRVIPIDFDADENTDYLHDIVLLADGSFLVAGWNLADSSSVNPKAAVAKLTSDGDLDETFGNDGVAVVAVPFSSSYFWFQQVIHQPDGKILYAGVCENCPDVLFGGRPFLFRLTTAGTPDTSFSGDGLVLAQTPPWNATWARAVALDSAGRILVLCGDADDLLVVRLTSTGTLDTSFGGGTGYVMVTQPEGAEAPFQFTVDNASGAMLISFNIFSGPDSVFAGVIRLDRHGVLDTTYGGDGQAELAFEEFFEIQTAHLQSDGKLLLAGTTTDVSINDEDPILFRLLPNGSPDLSFDGNGIALIDFHQGAGNDEDARAFGFSGGRPVVVGAVPVDGISRFGISRLQSTLIFTDGLGSGTLAGWAGN